jgi:hypothetical protein
MSTSQVAFYTNRVGKFEKMSACKQYPEVTKLAHRENVTVIDSVDRQNLDMIKSRHYECIY